MNKKAFTLIELLAVITVLGIVLAISVPIVSNTINNSRQKAFEDNELLLENAAKNYVLGETVSVPTTPGEYIELNYADMLSDGYIEQIYDIVDKTECTTSTVIVKRITQHRTDYIANLICSTNRSDEIVLEGSIETTVTLGDSSDDPGAIALDGSAVTSDYSTVVDMNTPGTYTVTYSTDAETKTRKVTVQ